METGLETSRIVINIALGLVSFVGSTIIPFLIAKVGKWLRARAKNEESNALLIAYNNVSGAVYDVVKAAQATFVKEIKEANADGKLTKEDATNIKRRVVGEIVRQTNDKTLEMLGEDGANLGMIISTMVESNLVDVKTGEMVIHTGVQFKQDPCNEPIKSDPDIQAKPAE